MTSLRVIFSVVFLGFLLPSEAQKKDSVQNSTQFIGMSSEVINDRWLGVTRVESFNEGLINDPLFLIKGLAPGFQAYKAGSDPNGKIHSRIRGLNSIGSDVSPLIVVDGMLGIDLASLDPASIESINVVRSGSLTSLYGIRGANGVIEIQTKFSDSNQLKVTYQTGLSVSALSRKMPVFSASEYIANGGNDQGAVTDWQDEVTRTSVSNTHHLFLSGGVQNTRMSLSANLRNVGGILKTTGFNRSNLRFSLSQSAFKNKLNFFLTSSLTQQNSDISFNEAFRYAILSSPTMPVTFENGNYYQPILFDNYNPSSIIGLNDNLSERSIRNLATKMEYALLPALTLGGQLSAQVVKDEYYEFYSPSSFFRGSGFVPEHEIAYSFQGWNRYRDSQARHLTGDFYGKFKKQLSTLTVKTMVGLSLWNQDMERVSTVVTNVSTPVGQGNIGILTEDYLNANNYGLHEISSSSPQERIRSFYLTQSFDWNEKLSTLVNYRRDGSTRLGEDNQWGNFYGVSVAANLSSLLGLGSWHEFKIFTGLGRTGALPFTYGLSKEETATSNDTEFLVRKSNPNLSWEESDSFDIGFSLKHSNVPISLDFLWYSKKVNNIIRDVYLADEAVSQYQNTDQIDTKGIEVAISTDPQSIFGGIWSSSLVATRSNSTFTKLSSGTQMVGSPGPPCGCGTLLTIQKQGMEVGTFWGPVYDGVLNGGPTFRDLNGDGQINAFSGDALAENSDFKDLGSGLPAIELTWNHNFDFNKLQIGFQLWSQLGHSIANTFRLAYEPVDPGAINSYNRVNSSLAISDLQTGIWSSLYVEDADFLRLSFLRLGYQVLSNDLFNLSIEFVSQNLFTLTSYTGLDPEAIIVSGPITSNGGFGGYANYSERQMTPGITSRNEYPTAKTFTIGVKISMSK